MKKTLLAAAAVALFGLPVIASAQGKMVFALVPKNTVWPSRGNWSGEDTIARSVLRSANRLIELPACSNRVQKTTEPSISTKAASPCLLVRMSA